MIRFLLSVIIITIIVTYCIIPLIKPLRRSYGKLVKKINKQFIDDVEKDDNNGR